MNTTNLKIIVPYRNRPEMLKHWEHIENRLIVELAGNGEWNREILFNVGILETLEMFLVFNDIDHIPLEPYVGDLGITQLAKSTIQLKDYLGGVTMFDRITINKIGGFHNDFWGGRGGDNEMRFNISRYRIIVKEKEHKFKILHHERPAMEFVREQWIKAKKPRVFPFQTSLLRYEKEEISPNHIKVNIKQWK
jgi:hypothetical protein